MPDAAQTLGTGDKDQLIESPRLGLRPVILSAVKCGPPLAWPVDDGDELAAVNLSDI
jgi:hypothetical protein